jgi:hypothetical protein
VAEQDRQSSQETQRNELNNSKSSYPDLIKHETPDSPFFSPEPIVEELSPGKKKVSEAMRKLKLENKKYSEMIERGQLKN